MRVSIKELQRGLSSYLKTLPIEVTSRGNVVALISSVGEIGGIKKREALVVNEPTPPDVEVQEESPCFKCGETFRVNRYTDGFGKPFYRCFKCR